MKSVRKFSNKCYFRQIMACAMVFWLFFAPLVVQANVNPVADALPSGVISSTGIDPLNYTPGNLEITQTAGQAIINWQNFDIGADASVQFIQPGSAAAVMNRVHDAVPTGIMGAMTANGRVFIVNPAGVVFGSGAVINVGRLVASSLDIADDDFINGIYDFTVPGIGEIANYGTIDAVEGVALLGSKVLNTGTIKAGEGGFQETTAIHIGSLFFGFIGRVWPWVLYFSRSFVRVWTISGRSAQRFFASLGSFSRL